MCDPITLAGVALTGASYAANAVGASKAAKARDHALAAETRRQGALQQEANAINTQSQDRYQDFGAQEDARGKELADYFTGQSASPLGQDANAASSLPVSSSNITVQEDAKQRGAAKAFTDRQGTALGHMRAFGDVLGDVSRKQARDAGQIGQIGGFMQGSSGVLPYELEAASQKGAGARLFGDLLGAAGQIGITAGLSGAGGNWVAKDVGTAADPWAYARKVGKNTIPRENMEFRLGPLFGGN
ncbi:hypothetical protein [Aureimonas leprariae]|uniref:Uncharacterized protein n=1 Tax=Plantimonas leprariae TaxID=2615207 RepID=A0A7V7TVQ7_9HYPH|nr:hypothetical protein [Aureimonas leprariae]KAB0678052.1 hypothetical protein F6X38_16635 [Aureimonas leprariae]